MRTLLPALVMVGLTTACATTQPSTPCTGEVVLELRNETLSEVEVVERRRGSGGGVVIGVFGPGFHTVGIRNEPGFYYSTRFVGGGTAAAETAPRAGTRDVGMTRSCREAPTSPSSWPSGSPSPRSDLD
jgi:hypothetical protein